MIDDTALQCKLQEWEDFYNFKRRIEASTDKTPHERLAKTTESPRV